MTFVESNTIAIKATCLSHHLEINGDHLEQNKSLNTIRKHSSNFIKEIFILNSLNIFDLSKKSEMRTQEELGAYAWGLDKSSPSTMDDNNGDQIVYGREALSLPVSQCEMTLKTMEEAVKNKVENSW